MMSIKVDHVNQHIGDNPQKKDIPLFAGSLNSTPFLKAQVASLRRAMAEGLFWGLSSGFSLFV